MRTLLVGAMALAMLVAVASVPAVAQGASGTPSVSMAQALSQEIERRATERAKGEGADFWHGEIGSLNAGERRTDSLGTLTQDVEVVTLAAFCDANCGQLDLSVVDTNNEIVVQSDSQSDRPTVTFQPEAGKEYRARVTVVRCDSEPCFYSMGAFYTLRGE